MEAHCARLEIVGADPGWLYFTRRAIVRRGRCGTAASRRPAWVRPRGASRRPYPKGQVVIPKEMRERAGLRPGSEVEFELDGERILLAARPARTGPDGRFAGSGMADRLLVDRAREPK